MLAELLGGGIVALVACLVVAMLILRYSTLLRDRVFAYRWESQGVCHLTDEHLKQIKTEVFSSLRGKILDLGAGNGVNFQYYEQCSAVTSVVAVEPNANFQAKLLKAGQAYQEASNASVDIVHGTLDDMPLNELEGTFDSVVCCLVYCSIPDARRAMRQAWRLLKPQGTLVFIEHCGDKRGTLRRVAQDIMTPVWNSCYGCSMNRDTVAALQSEAKWSSSSDLKAMEVAWIFSPFIYGTLTK